MDWEMLRTVVDILKTSGATEIALEYGDTKIQVKKAAGPQVAPLAVVEQAAAEVEETEEGGPPSPPPLIVKAGRVGVFHRQEQPDAEPLVQVGKEVQEGETIAYIESVKLMTEVLSPQRAKVSDLLADDGEAVEYGRPLFALEPLPEEVEKEETE